MSDQITELIVLEEISGKLDRVIAMLAITGKEQDEQIKILRSLGIDWNLIGDLVGLKPSTARMRMKK